MIQALVRISLTTHDLAALMPFYAALGFEVTGRQVIDAAIYGVEDTAEVATLHLGRQEIELVQFARPGAPYPPGRSSHDRFFQHIALVTTDIDGALARLPAQATMISRDSPARLPAASGGVAAAKFRDPDGHPLELLQFPKNAVPEEWQPLETTARTCIGIDHSAVVSEDTIRSIEFYCSRGLRVITRSLNTGIEQDRLDDVEAARVDVVALAPPVGTPHVELLGYRSPGVRPGLKVANNDVAATRLIMRCSGGGGPLQVTDPDGHRLILRPD